MATSNATIAVNYDQAMYLTLVSDIPPGTVAVAGKDVSLLPSSATENQFILTFQAGIGVASVNGIAVTSVSSTSVSVKAQASGGVVIATCTYNSFLLPAPTANFMVFYTKSTFEQAFEDPTIVFNPPSGFRGIESEETLVAEAVMA
jgi:hypothetical protein